MAYNKIVFGDQTIIDLSLDTATIDTVVNGVPFMGKNGVIQVGTMPVSGATIVNTELIMDGGLYTSSWSTASDAEIVKALRMHYSGWCDLTEIWNIGDERTFQLSDGNEVVYKLGTPLYGGTFSLIPKYAVYTGKYMGTTTGTYDANSTLRPWCNTTYYNYFSPSVIEIFKPAYSGDYFYIPSSTEATAYMGIMQLANGTKVNYWTRTKARYDRFYAVNTSGQLETWRGDEDPAAAIPLGEI